MSYISLMILNICKKILISLRFTLVSYYRDYKLDPFSTFDGKNYFEAHCRVYRSSKIKNVTLGKFSYIQTHSEVANANIGAFSSIGSRVKIGGFGKHMFGMSTHPAFYDKTPPTKSFYKKIPAFMPYKQVILGNDVWVGDRCIILDGVKVGDGAIIGAGATVAKDVPPYAIVVGNPMRIIRYRFSDAEIAYLLKEKWWERSTNDLKLIASQMHTNKKPSETI
mgnify:FL=1